MAQSEPPPPYHHDLGGAARFRCTPIEPDDPPLSDFDRRVDALRALLRQKGLITTDEQRLAIESLPPEAYDGLTYYEKWLRAIVAVLLARGVIGWEDLA
ncbi:MAG: nitrile hydratase subunit beta [Rhodovarius sp.]|nr:nitrile hydratase subunit beta [Rhodovarius sp.]MCX7933405.1 nitrile hydratase subunit beta [Rhodovarius sp.]